MALDVSPVWVCMLLDDSSLWVDLNGACAPGVCVCMFCKCVCLVYPCVSLMRLLGGAAAS